MSETIIQIQPVSSSVSQVKKNQELMALSPGERVKNVFISQFNKYKNEAKMLMYRFDNDQSTIWALNNALSSKTLEENQINPQDAVDIITELFSDSTADALELWVNMQKDIINQISRTDKKLTEALVNEIKKHLLVKA